MVNLGRGYMTSLLIGYAGCVLFSEGPPVDEFGNGLDSGLGSGEDDKTLTVSSVVKGCLAGADPFLPCINERAMAALEQTETMDTVRLDPGLEIARPLDAEGIAPRGVYSFGKLHPNENRRFMSLNFDINPNLKPRSHYKSFVRNLTLSPCEQDESLIRTIAIWLSFY